MFGCRQKRFINDSDTSLLPAIEHREKAIGMFRGLTDNDLKAIIDIELSKVSKRLLEKGLTLVLTEEAKMWLIKKGSSKEYGARPLRRAIEQFLEDPMAEDLLRGGFTGKDDEGDPLPGPPSIIARCVYPLNRGIA